MADPKRIYLDQMFGNDVARALAASGHDVVRAAERGQARADDREILDRAIAEGRILITLDEHFGDWAVLPLSRHPGVVRLKIHPATAGTVVDALAPFLDRHSSEEFACRLVILSKSRTRWIRTG